MKSKLRPNRSTRVNLNYGLLAIPVLVFWTSTAIYSDEFHGKTQLGVWLPVIGVIAVCLDRFALRVGLQWTSEAAPLEYLHSPWRRLIFCGIGACVVGAPLLISHADARIPTSYWVWYLLLTVYVAFIAVRAAIRED